MTQNQQEQALDFEPKEQLDDNTRDLAVNALKTLNTYFEKSNPFAPKIKPELKKTKENLIATLKKDGYSIEDQGVMTALSLFIDNLSRL